MKMTVSTVMLSAVMLIIGGVAALVGNQYLAVSHSTNGTVAEAYRVMAYDGRTHQYMIHY